MSDKDNKEKKYTPTIVWNRVKLFWKEPPAGKYLNLKEVLCLGAASLGVSFICNLINMYITIGQLPLIYNLGTYGTLHATVIYLVASVLGLILTPIYGKLVQRTKTKFGRYKPYILFLAPVVSVLGVLAVWSPGNLDLAARITYVYCICIPTLLVWNIWFNTYNLFPGVFTPNQQERVDVWSPIGLVMGFAPTVMNVLKDVCAGIWGDVAAARIFGIMSAVVGCVCIVGLIKVKERVFVTEKENNSNKIGVFQGLKMVFKNKPLMILTLALMLGCMKGTIDMIWHIVARVKYAGDMATAAKIFGSVSLIIGFAATPNMLLMPLFTRKFNNRTIMIFWQALNTGAYLILACVGFQNLQPGTSSALIITALRFVASFNAMGSLQPLMLSEIGDYQQKVSGYRLEGFVQTVAYSVPLVVTQLCALIPALIQGKIGFNPNDYEIVSGASNVLSADVIGRLNTYGNIAMWISVASGALMLFCLFFYTLDKKKHAAIIKELQETSTNAEEIEATKIGDSEADEVPSKEEADTAVDFADVDNVDSADNTLGDKSSQDDVVGDSTSGNSQNGEVNSDV